MEVLVVSISDKLNGASKALYRIHNSFNSLKTINSKMIVFKKLSNSESVIEIKYNFIFKLKRKLNTYLTSILYLNKSSYTLFSHNIFSNNEIIKTINNSNADICVLGWVNGGVLNIKNLKKIKKPIVWVMEDMWNYTGGCHYTNNCLKYNNICCACPLLMSKSKFDLSRLGQIQKERLYTNKEIIFIAISNWIQKTASNSSLLKNRTIKMIPNTIDTDFFKKNDNIMRKQLGLPEKVKLIVFGATRAKSDVRKGLNILLEVFKNFDDEDYCLVIYGTEEKIDIKKSIINYGVIDNNKSLINLLSVSDAFVSPSTQEAFGLTALEAISCSLPLICFKDTGTEDLVEHKKNGYLAKYLNVYDLEKGIKWVLENNDLNILGKRSREKALKEFSYRKVSKEYYELFNELLNKK